MSIPQSIQAQLSDRTLSKVTRLFNASLSDILNELLQNTRRAQASQVNLHLDENGQLTIEDDGIGIADPQVLLTLGGSNWEASTQSQEDPAGMGFFSLAHRTVQVRSHRWQVELCPKHFNGEESAAIHQRCDYHFGTQLKLTLSSIEQRMLPSVLESVSKYYPLPVWFNNQALDRQEFLASSVYIEHWQGLKIGVRLQYSYDEKLLNFYGLLVKAAFPTLQCNNQTLRVRIDVVDCPQLKLVLPTRKEVVQDEFWTQLQQEIHCVLYRYVKTLPQHDLTYRCWEVAQSLGIDLPTAHAQLDPFVPDTSNRFDEHSISVSCPVTDRALLFDLSNLDVSEQQCFWRAFQQAQLDEQPVTPRPSYQGYAWYDRLPRLQEVQFEIEVEVEQSGEVQTVVHTLALWQQKLAPKEKHTLVKRIWAIVEVVYADGQTQTRRLPMDVLFVDAPDSYYWEDFEQMTVVLAQGHQLQVEELVELFEKCYFSPTEDSDSDSIQTQYDNFREDAYERAASILLSQAEALKLRLQMVAERHLRWMIPTNCMLKLCVMPREEGQQEIEVAID